MEGKSLTIYWYSGCTFLSMVFEGADTFKNVECASTASLVEVLTYVYNGVSAGPSASILTGKTISHASRHCTPMGFQSYANIRSPQIVHEISYALTLFFGIETDGPIFSHG